MSEVLAKIQKALADEGLQASSWSNGPHFSYGVHEHDTHKVLFVSQGSIVFHLHKGGGVEDVSLKPGDRMDLPPHTKHSADVGPQGVTCVEAHK